MLGRKDVTQIFTIGHYFFVPSKCDFISLNVAIKLFILQLYITQCDFILHNCSFKSLFVTLYLTFAALFHTIICDFISPDFDLNVTSYLGIVKACLIAFDFISCFKLLENTLNLRNTFLFFTLRQKHASIDGTEKVQ